MPKLTRGPAERELQRLIELFLQAETDIINEIGRLRSLGLVDYHAEAALERVQAILRKLETDCWTYVPRMIETQFYVRHPEARRPLEEPETPEKHLRAYQNARSLTGEQTDIAARLTMNLMGQITEADAVAAATLADALLGRAEPDVFRRTGLEQTARMAAAGRGAYRALPGFVEALRREGVTAFVDRAGRRWSLHTYGSMVLRTTSRQAEIMAVLTADPDHDLYQISAHGTTCRLCAGLEGRVYSKSGTDPDFPPLAAAFGKMDPAGPDTLANSWLNIHPNCLHQLRRWTPMGRSAEEVQKIKDFSSFEKNPPDRDPRTEKQIRAYREKEANRARYLRDYRQWEQYREALGKAAPGTFETFRRHKYAVTDPETGKRGGDEKFRGWAAAYRKRNGLANLAERDILKDTRYKAIPVTDEAIQRVPRIRPQGWSAKQAEQLQEAHRELLRAVKDKPVGTEAGAVYTPDMQLIERRVGKDADQTVSLPHCTLPHISIHSHPSGEVFSAKDLETFFYNENMNGMTVVGNSGKVYAILKSAEYDGFRFGAAFFDMSIQLKAAVKDQEPDRYINIIKNFLKGASQYGAYFVES
mgnify:CR=1 FL=1|jgi:hypothetical protein